MHEKKSEELWFVTQFLEAAGMSYFIEPGESPDFVLKSQEDRLGLEVTHLFHPSSEPALLRRRVESLRSRVVSRAQSLFEMTTHPPIHVSVFFNPSRHINKTDVSFLAEKLANLVLRNIPEPEGHRSEEYDWVNREWFPEEIDSVSVGRPAQLLKSHWSAPDAVYIPECSIELVQGVIESKNAKLVNYAKTVTNCCLLIVLDDFRLSGTFKMSQAVVGNTYSSGFKSIYLFQPFERRFYSLKTSPL